MSLKQYWCQLELDRMQQELNQVVDTQMTPEEIVVQYRQHYQHYLDCRRRLFDRWLGNVPQPVQADRLTQTQAYDAILVASQHPDHPQVTITTIDTIHICELLQVTITVPSYKTLPQHYLTGFVRHCPDQNPYCQDDIRVITYWKDESVEHNYYDVISHQSVCHLWHTT